MLSIKNWFFALLVISALISGCDSQKQTPESQIPEPSTQAPQIAPRQVSPILTAPSNIQVGELSTDALLTWRSQLETKPTLVLFSDEPFLQPIPEALREAATTLILQGSPDELHVKASNYRAEAILLPGMALSAALRAELFAKVVWVLPTRTTTKKVLVETFRRQLLDHGLIGATEAATLTQQGNTCVGTLRGTPFQALYPSSLPEIAEPVVLHLDLSYFRPLYKGEIKTPLLQIVYQTLRSIRATGWKAQAVTLSLSNQTEQLPLDTRFLGTTLSELFQEPALLDAPLPKNWQRRGNALYLPNLMQDEKTRDLYLAMEQLTPQDASVKFGLYQVHRRLKEGSKSLDYLQQAIALDKGYALEYLQLVTVAQEKQRPDQALKMLRLAALSFPDDPYITLQLAGQLIELKHGNEALTLLEELHKLPWSKVYNPEMAKNLENAMIAARAAKRSPAPQ
jgi:hypothetical protein